MKTTSILFFIFILIGTPACLSDREDDEKIVKLFNGLKLQLSEDETVSPMLTDAIQKLFVSYLGDTVEASVPLFKHIKHSSYDIFVGLPFQQSINDFVNQNGLNTKEVIHLTDSSTYDFRSYQKENVTISRYVVEKSDNLLLMLGVTVNKATSDDLLGYKKLADRID